MTLVSRVSIDGRRTKKYINKIYIYNNDNKKNIIFLDHVG